MGHPCFHLNTPFQARQRGLRFGLSDKTSTVFWVLLEHNDIWVLTEAGCCVIIVISCSYSTIKSSTAAGNTGWHCFFLFFLPARGVLDLASAVRLQQIDGCFWRIMTWVDRGRTTYGNVGTSLPYPTKSTTDVSNNGWSYFCINTLLLSRRGGDMIFGLSHL